MKTIVIVILTIVTFFISDKKANKITSKYNCPITVEEKGRCTGSANCSVCSNCSRCAHCSNGGSCGVCSGSSSNNFSSTPKTKKKATTYYYKSIQQSKVYYEDESITIYSESINVREEPSTKSKILEKLNYGDTVIFIEKTGEWSKVKVEKSGIIGYVLSKLLS